MDTSRLWLLHHPCAVLPTPAPEEPLEMKVRWSQGIKDLAGAVTRASGSSAGSARAWKRQAFHRTGVKLLKSHLAQEILEGLKAWEWGHPNRARENSPHTKDSTRNRRDTSRMCT